MVLAQPFDADEQFWKVVVKNAGKDSERTEYEFCYVNSQNFLQNRGFGRLRRLDRTYQFVHLEPPVVRSIEASDARDYLFQFAKHNCCVGVNEMLIKGVLRERYLLILLMHTMLWLIHTADLRQFHFLFHRFLCQS